jgi:hypothetical protein
MRSRRARSHRSSSSCKPPGALLHTGLVAGCAAQDCCAAVPSAKHPALSRTVTELMPAVLLNVGATEGICWTHTTQRAHDCEALR